MSTPTVTIEHALEFNQITEKNILEMIDQQGGIQGLARNLVDVSDNTNIDDGYGQLADTAHHRIEGGRPEVLAHLTELAEYAADLAEAS